MKKVVTKFESFDDVKKVFIANIPFFFILLFLILGVYLNGVKGEFVSDDLPAIVNNPNIKNFDKVLAKGNVHMILISALYNAFSLNQIPFHITSLVFHIVNVFLFFLITYSVFGKKAAALTALLYAVHPGPSEAVLWISAINYQISTFVTYIIIILYLIYKKNNDIKILVFITIFLPVFILSFQNAWVLTIPLIIAGVDFFLLNEKDNFKPLLKLIPMIILCSIAFFSFNTERVSGRIAELQTQDASPYLNRLPYSIYKNTELLVFPKSLSLYHEGEVISPNEYTTMIITTVIVVLTTLFLWRSKKYRKYGGLLILIFLSLAPVFSPIQVSWFVADRYLYVGTGFFCIILALIFLAIEQKSQIKNAAIILTAILVVIYSVRTFYRTQDWKTRKSLWLATQKIAPYSSRVYNNLGDVFALERDYKNAIASFQMSIKLNPNYSEAMHNLGYTYMTIQQFDKAREVLLRSVAINPGLYQSYHKLGILEYNVGNLDLAVDYFYKTLEVNPNSQEAIASLNALKQKHPELDFSK